MDQEELGGGGKHGTVVPSVEDATARVVAEAPYVTIIAAIMALGAAVVALVVPVFSGGIDPATGVLLLLVLLTPMYLHDAVRRNMRRGYRGRSIGYALAALVASAVFAIVLIFFIAVNKPMCLSSCDPAQSAAQQATSGCFTVSLLLYLLSGIVGLFAAAGNRDLDVG
jgi:hypothetical protein